ncbi:MAG TPA: hypothetical protein VH817_00365 [Thermoleophilaceae bacterium]
MNDEEWKDHLADDEWSDLGEDDEFVVVPPWARPRASDSYRPLPLFKVLYGPVGAVRSDLARARRQMNIAAASSKRPSDPRRN